MNDHTYIWHRVAVGVTVALAYVAFLLIGAFIWRALIEDRVVNPNVWRTVSLLWGSLGFVIAAVTVGFFRQQSIDQTFANLGPDAMLTLSERMKEIASRKRRQLEIMMRTTETRTVEHWENRAADPVDAAVKTRMKSAEKQ